MAAEKAKGALAWQTSSRLTSSPCTPWACRTPVPRPASCRSAPRVERSPGGEAQALIVEDVFASGARAARTIQAVQAETRLEIAGILSIANWNFPEIQVRLAPWTVRAITSYPQVPSV